MAGIQFYGAYIPYHRLKRSAVAQTYGKSAGKGSKAVAYYDEDSITMSVSAAMRALEGTDASSLDAVLFASTTPPYKEKLCAPQIAAALDAKENIRATDFGGGLRAFSSAMLSSMDMASEESNVLVATGDCRMGAADGEHEMELGDAGAAFVMGNKNVIAECKATYSVAKEFTDVWRSKDDDFIRNWDVRYADTQLYTPMIIKAVRGLLAKAGISISDIAKVACYGHTDKVRLGALAKAGFTPEQIQPSRYEEIGNTGCAATPIMLCDALDAAKAGDRLLMLTYGEGCDALLFEVTPEIEKYKRSETVEALVDRKNDSLPYGKYLKWKGLIDCEPQKRPAQERSALPDLYRNYKKNNSLWGSRCTKCGTPQFPAQRVCVRCRAVDSMEPYQFLGRKAYVRTFTCDGQSVSLDPPNNLVVVGFEGGGKMMTFLVDCRKEDIFVGMEVKPSFRRMFEANGIQTYFWKVVPCNNVKEGEGK